MRDEAGGLGANRRDFLGGQGGEHVVQFGGGKPTLGQGARLDAGFEARLRVHRHGQQLGPSCCKAASSAGRSALLRTSTVRRPKAVARRAKSGKATPEAGVAPTMRPKKLSCVSRIDR